MMQAQTFYFSNMTPQNYSLNQNPWAALEKMARDNWMCSDTLYVVTGAYWNPGSTFATPDIDGKQCPVPNYYSRCSSARSRAMSARRATGWATIRPTS